MIRLLLATTFLIASSPDPSVPNSADGYRCFAWERHIVQVACPPGKPGPCFGTSGFALVPAPVRAEQVELGYQWKGIAQHPLPNQVVFGCCVAVTTSGATSECVVTGSKVTP